MEREYTHQIIGFNWSKDEIPYPFVELRSFTGQELTTISLGEPYNFQWLLSPQRYCIGWQDKAGRHTCPLSNKLTGKREQCFTCEHKTGFKSASWFGGTPNEYMADVLKQEHYVYLAYFPPHIIKVGTAAGLRRFQRLIEQDALLAMFIAKIDGFNVQKLERYISKTLNYSETVSKRHKFRFLAERIDVQEAKPMLKAAYQRIAKTLAGKEYQNWLIEPEIVDFTKNPYIYYPNPESHLEIVEEPQFLTGNYLGLRDKYLFLEQAGNTYVVSTIDLTGRYIQAVVEELNYPAPVVAEQLNLSLVWQIY